MNALTASANAAVLAVLNSLWQAAALAVAAWILMRLRPGLSAATRVAIWWGVLLITALLPFISYTLQSRPEAAIERIASPPVVLQQHTQDASPAPAVSSREAAIPAPLSRLRPLELQPGLWPLALVALWLAAVLWQATRLAWSYRHLLGLKRRAIEPSPKLQAVFDRTARQAARPVRLLVSSEILSPMAAGFRHPAVILPQELLADLSPVELEHVLLHELGHVARFDDWTNLAGRLVGTLFPLHPVAIWILHRIEEDREVACDEWVVASTGEARPYANSLARLFEICLAHRPGALASGMAGRASHLGERIEILLKGGRVHARRASLLNLALFLAVLLPAAFAASRTKSWIVFASPAQRSGAPVGDKTSIDWKEGDLERPLRALRAARAVTHAYSGLLASSASASVSNEPAAAEDRPHSFLADLVAAGYGGLSVDEIVDLKTAGISGDYLRGIAKAGWGHIAPKDLIDLAHHGVSPEYVRQVHEAGLKDVSLRQAIDLRVHGVDPRDVREIHALGFGPYSAEQITDFAVHGVRAAYFRELKDAGFAHLDPEEIMDARNNGVSARDFRASRQYGSNLTLRQIIRLKQSGVL
jgi:beta-lactamase regulating signal transducer with metallopeptidase domain